MTSEIVQVYLCIEVDGHVTQCEESEADFFGVYYGGPGDLMCAADFNTLNDAINWATEVAENNNCPLLLALEILK